MRLSRWLALAASLAGVCSSLALPLSAQSAIDSAVYRQAIPLVDSIATASAQLCDNKSVPGYYKPVCTIPPRLRTVIKQLLAAQQGTPAPHDSTGTTPDSSKDSTVVVKPDSTADTTVVVTQPPPPPPPAPALDTATHDGLAELPRVRVDASYPRQSFHAVRVPAGANLQAYLDMAQPGDELLLPPGATFTGNFVLKDRGGPSWIVVRTDVSLVLPSTRMTPSSAGTNRLARIVTPNSSPALATVAGAHHWRVTGVEVTGLFTASETYTLVALGESGSAQNSLAQVPHDLILDRVWVHGTPTSVLRRCVALNSASSAVVDSWLSDCHSNVSDSQAVWGCNGPGPYRIANNHLEAGHEIVMFGGCDPSISQLVPSDIEIVGNHFTRPLAWKGVWQSKNILESKNSRRVLVEGNVFERVWASAQIGTWLELKSENQNGAATWTNTADWTVRYNAVNCVANGINISGHGSLSFASVASARFAIHDNVISGINTPDCNGAGIQLQLLNELTDAVIARNTWIVAGASPKAISFAGAPLVRLVLNGNVFSPSTYGLIGTGTGVGTVTLTQYAPGVTFTNNVLPGANCSLYPATTSCPSALPATLPTSTAGADLAKVTAATMTSVVAP